MLFPPPMPDAARLPAPVHRITPRTLALRARAPKRRWCRDDLTPDLVAVICERVSHGSSLSSICREADMPPLMSLWSWFQRDDALHEQLQRAMEVRAHRWAEEVLEIADASTGETHQADRLRVDVRRWLAAKFYPKMFGERVLPGGEGSTTVNVGVSVALPPGVEPPVRPEVYLQEWAAARTIEGTVDERSDTHE